MLCTTESLVTAARSRGAGVAAFNVITIEHAEAVAAAAEATGLPAIVQISQNAVRYHRGVRPLAAAVRAIADDGTAPLSLHLDHVEDEELLRLAVACGASSVMSDASKLPDTENAAATRAAARWAHDNGLWIEAELGEVGGKVGPHDPFARTDPVAAAHFVEATGVDALAVAVGSSHAMLARTARLDLELVSRLRDAVPVPLVLHGSSGVAPDTLREAVARGMTKINIGTLLNIAFTGSVRDGLLRDPALVDPRRYLAPARDALTEAAVACMRAISAGPSAGPPSAVTHHQPDRRT